MKKLIVISMLLAPMFAGAQENADEYIPSIDEIVNQMRKHDPDLTPTGAKSWTLSNQSGEGIPVMQADNQGKIMYLHGDKQAVLVCAAQDWCSIELEKGEQVRTTKIGNDVFWATDAAITGGGSDAVTHVLVRPNDVGLTTRLWIFTNKREYNIKLESTLDRSMPVISFTYPETIEAKFNELYAGINKPEVPSVQLKNEKRDHAYRVKGDAPFKPSAVYTDGERTIVEFPPELAAGELPILLLVGKGKKTQVANYRVVPACNHGDESGCDETNNFPKFVVDTWIKKARLQTGRKRKNRQRVEIFYEGDQPPVENIVVDAGNRK